MPWSRSLRSCLSLSTTAVLVLPLTLRRSRRPSSPYPMVNSPRHSPGQWLDSARRKATVPAVARWLLGLGIAATLAANLAHGLGHGPVGAAVAAWPAVALGGSYELLMMVIRGSQPAPGGVTGSADNPDPLGEQAAEIFADQLAAHRVPSVRAIRAQLHVGQPRAQRLRGYLATGE